MSYATNDELPEALKRHLPSQALDIYRKVFNHAFAHYGRGNEAVAHRVAWSAVRSCYEKIAGAWRPRLLN
jgi:cation transport regulator